MGSQQLLASQRVLGTARLAVTHSVTVSVSCHFTIAWEGMSLALSSMALSSMAVWCVGDVAQYLEFFT